MQEVTKMKKLDQIYEGKAKKVFKTEDPDLLSSARRRLRKESAARLGPGGGADAAQ